MKKVFQIALISLSFCEQSLLGNPFWQFMNKLPILGKNVPTISKDKVANFENLNALTIIPSTDCSPHNILTTDQVCTAIRDGNNKKNNEKCVIIETLSTKKLLFKLSTKIPSRNYGIICISVPGYAGFSGNARYKYAGSGAYTAFNYIKANLIPKDAVIITFDGQVSYRAYFNFGQQLDQNCLNTIYEKTTKKNPKAKIVLYGSCKGATTILNYLTNLDNKHKKFDNHIKAIVLESPSISFETITDHIARTHVPKQLQFILPYLFASFFPNYKWGQLTMIDLAENLPSNIPILIGYLQQDTTANYEDILKIYDQFKKAGKNNVSIFKSENTMLNHGHLSKAKDFQQRVQEFLKKNV